MKRVGGAVSQLAYGANISPDAASVLTDAKTRAHDLLKCHGFSVDLVVKAQGRFLECVGLCESPIEQMMLAALAFMVMPGTDCFPPAIHDVMNGEPWPVKPVVIVPQFVISRYRLDFLVVVSKTMIAIECDGRDHHTNLIDRARDHGRDQYLKALGIKTLRYTGSWITRNQWKVADEIAAIAQEALESA